MFIDFKNKPLFLAPMADYTDQPFSLLCREVSGEDFIIFREMVSAEAIVRNNKKTLLMCQIDKKERPVVIQIFGDNPKTIALAAKIVNDEFGPDGIDINMGCPVPKIAQKTRAGASLMRYPDLAEEIVSSVKLLKLNLLLSIKTRLGWSDNNDILKFAPRMEKAGADFITIHGRTKAQGYSGTADWHQICKTKKLLNIPLVANGDIISVVDAQQCFKQTTSDGIMVGRGALGNPWIFKKIKNTDNSPIPKEELIATILRHADLHVARYGERGIVTLRKHLAWYFHGQRNSNVTNLKAVRAKLVQINSKKELNEVLSSI